MKSQRAMCLGGYRVREVLRFENACSVARGLSFSINKAVCNIFQKNPKSRGGFGKELLRSKTLAFCACIESFARPVILHCFS